MSPSTPARPLQATAAGAVAVCLLVSARAIWSVCAGWGQPLLGAPGGEVWGHAWVQWWHADAFPGWPDGPGAWVTGARSWPVIDPLVTGLAAAVGSVASPVVAWNVLVVLGVAGAFVGGSALAKSRDGDPLVGGVALALAPAFLGTVASGLTEDLAIGLAALGLGRVGSPDSRSALAGGVCLGVLTACGLVLSWAVAVAALGLGLWSLVSAPRKGPVVRGLALGGWTACLLAIPTAWMHSERLGGTGHRLGQFLPRPEPLWRLNPWKGIDPASFLVPGHVDPGDALIRMHPGYLGVSLVVLALGAGWSRWWVVLGASMACSLGPHISFAGMPTGIENPVMGLIQLVPFGALINHHGRLLLVGSIALSLLAAQGARQWTLRFGPWSRWGILALVTLDLALLGPVGAPLPTADPTPLGVYTHPDFAGLPTGAVLQLPAAGPGVHFQRPLLDQRAHRRPLLLDPNRPGLSPALARTDTGRFLASLAAPDPVPAPAAPVWPDSAAVVVVSEPYVDRVEAAFGPPTLRTPDSAAWTR